MTLDFYRKFKYQPSTNLLALNILSVTNFVTSNNCSWPGK